MRHRTLPFKLPFLTCGVSSGSLLNRKRLVSWFIMFSTITYFQSCKCYQKCRFMNRWSDGTNNYSWLGPSILGPRTWSLRDISQIRWCRSVKQQCIILKVSSLLNETVLLSTTIYVYHCMFMYRYTRGDSPILKHFYFIYKFLIIRLSLQNIFYCLYHDPSVLLIMEWSSFLHLSHNARLRLTKW